MAGVNLTNELRRLIIKKAKDTIPLADSIEGSTTIEAADFDRIFINKKVYEFYKTHEEMCMALVAGYDKPKLDRNHHLWVEIPDSLINFTCTDYIKYYESDPYCGAQHFRVNAKDKHPEYFVIGIKSKTDCPIPSTTDNGTHLSSDYAVHYNSSRTDFKPKSHRSCSWDEAPDSVKAAIGVWLSRCAALDKRGAIEHDMKALLDECNTVGQFLKIFPEGQHLLPHDIIQRLHAKPKPKRKTEISFNSDLSHVKQSILIDKIGAA